MVFPLRICSTLPELSTIFRAGARGRIIDLSVRAARALGMMQAEVVRVSVE